MSVRRALVLSTVLSLQDTCVFYPCCKGCLSRINAEKDTTRYRCSKCGYMYLREHVEYRYRLSLRVTRDKRIFGVTIFGNTLKPFFGISASGLQKLVETEPSTGSTLLVKAIKDCFIGRHFIFGIKLNGTENGHLFQGLLSNGSNISDTSQFIASQMILPNTKGPTGCTVVRYYQRLLQKALQLEPDCSKPYRPPGSPLFLLPCRSPTSSFSDSTLFPSGLLSQSPLRSKHQDSTISPTPLWQQSLGLVTSSAEQEEDSADEHNRHGDNSAASIPAEKSSLKSHKVTLEATPLFPLEISNSFVKNVVNDLRASQAVQKNCSLTQKEFYTRQHTTFLSSSLLWEDLPFSESLSEFLCEENKNSDIVGETGPNLNVDFQNKSNELDVGSASTSQRKVKITTNSSQRLQDVTNTPSPHGGDGHDVSHQVCEAPVKCRNEHKARDITSDEKASLCFEDEAQHEGDSYNCSADLFGNTFTISMNTEVLNEDADILKTNGGKPISETDCHRLINKSTCVSPVTPHKQEEKKTKRRIRESLIPQETCDFEFVPSSQSTPVVKVHLTQSPFFKNLISERTKENLTHSRTFGRRSHRPSPKTKFRKPAEHQTRLQFAQHVKLQRRNLNLESVNISYPKHDVRASDKTDCNLEDDEGIVAPTPAGKTQLSILLRGKRRADVGISDPGCSQKARWEDGVVLDQTFTSSHRSVSQKGDFGSETSFQAMLYASVAELPDDDNPTPDWSRDLFSDSI